jgi:hypothetical protein
LLNRRDPTDIGAKSDASGADRRALNERKYADQFNDCNVSPNPTSGKDIHRPTANSKQTQQEWI